MENNLKITKGVWDVADYLDKENGNRSLAVWVGQDQTICLVSPKISENKTDLANAKLIAEAGTVANETGKTPRQLYDENKILLEAINKIALRGGDLEGLRELTAFERYALDLSVEAINKTTL